MVWYFATAASNKKQEERRERFQKERLNSAELMMMITSLVNHQYYSFFGSTGKGNSRNLCFSFSPPLSFISLASIRLCLLDASFFLALFAQAQ
jgi:hypothetical protein